MKIDVFNHVMPARFLDRLADYVPAGPIRRLRSMATMHDADARVRMLDEFDDLQQIICLSLADPGLEALAGPREAAELARLGNDGMAEMCARHPDRLPGFIATVAMNDENSALAEIDRAIGELGAVGVQIHSNVAGKPLDNPEFLPIFERISQLDRPIWLHPCRSINTPDYPTETVSRFEIYWSLGWAFETSAAMTRIVYSGMFDKLPNLKIICHHWGAYIPHMEGRIPESARAIGNRLTGGSETHDAPVELVRPPIDYFKMFYGDTALFGAQAASQCGLDFFGAGHSLFASDAPFDAEGGAIKIRQTLAVVDALRASASDKQKIYEGNIRELIKLP